MGIRVQRFGGVTMTRPKLKTEKLKKQIGTRGKPFSWILGSKRTLKQIESVKKEDF